MANRNTTAERTDVDNTLRERRTVLRAVGSVAFAGLLTGCIDESSGDGDVTDGETNVDDWLSETGNYDSVEDMTGTDRITVEVGANGNNGANAFSPAAVEVSPGTTVTWEWADGYHNVVATDGAFDSGQPEMNATFEHTFETPGTSLYYCKPHKSMGMKGAIVVAGDEGESTEETETRTESR